ncbi:uncharacterized protein LOC123405961 [Hordeum vulgare subsp. vulgare]|uniref:uncharacterized protein LOC123405961 n=1 Tax=Hordeum vulgare subsp. vulgare TaxID=112509 RepID=UPI00162C3A6C|nr:uncharacterized protein LOC123405961 [Hordeum vulgare subsp. vulgare]
MSLLPKAVAASQLAAGDSFHPSGHGDHLEDQPEGMDPFTPSEEPKEVSSASEDRGSHAFPSDGGGRRQVDRSQTCRLWREEQKLQKFWSAAYLSTLGRIEMHRAAVTSSNHTCLPNRIR